MNSKRGPGLLRQIAQQKIGGAIIDWTVTWTDRLRSCEGLGTRDRLLVFRSVLTQCLQVQKLLTSLPQSACRTMTEDIFKVTALIIGSYHFALCLRVGNATCRRQCEEVCRYMLKAVCLPSIKECNLREIKSEFIKETLSQSLQTNPKITHLILPAEPSLQVTRFVYGNLHNLTQLQVFEFEVNCGTDVVVELGRHCTLLKILNVRSSVFVTDYCVEDLLNLQNLEKLYVAGTAISETCYAHLLSSLPRIQNIFWRGSVESVLQNITQESLPLVNEFNATVKDVPLLTQKCPRVKHLSIQLDTENSVDLIQLTDIVSLELEHCDYNINNVIILIESVGSRLTKLDMCEVGNIDFEQVVRCCCVLRTLVLRQCGITLPRSVFFNRGLPHFESVKEIKLDSNKYVNSFLIHLNHYVNLEVFHARWVAEIDDMILSVILKTGGFRKLCEIILHGCGTLTLETAMLLIQMCGSLSVLGNMSLWPDISSNDMKALFDCVKKNNLALSIKLI